MGIRGGTDCWKRGLSISAVISDGSPSMNKMGLGSDPSAAAAGPGAGAAGSGRSSSESSSIASAFVKSSAQQYSYCTPPEIVRAHHHLLLSLTSSPGLPPHPRPPPPPRPPHPLLSPSSYSFHPPSVSSEPQKRSTWKYQPLSSLQLFVVQL